MPGSIFIDKAKKPTEKDIHRMLGDAADLWDEFYQHLCEEYEPLSKEWKFYKSWNCTLKRKARTVCYIFAQDGYFTVAFIFGEKAVAAARASKLPKSILTEIEEARPYAEGRGFHVACKKPGDLKHLKTLASIKMAN
jgi:hypothetical protein